MRALAHLREAWCGADPRNQRAVEASIGALLAGHSLRDIPVSCRAVLTYRLEPDLARRLLRAVGLEEPVPHAGRP